MLAGGGECVADMAELRDQPDLLGDVALPARSGGPCTKSRPPSSTPSVGHGATPGERVWNAFVDLAEVVLDLDAALVEVNSEGKEKGGVALQGRCHR